MSIKLRSACDKCHEAKVRCSGGIPCQGCLISRCLCFYSVSNPLGRPKGTKKRQNRGGSKGNSTWDRDDVSNEDNSATMGGTAGNRGPRKRTQTRGGLNTPKDDDDHTTSSSRNTVVSGSQREDMSELLGSGGPAPGDNPPFIPNYHGHNVGMSAVAAPNDFRLNSMSPTANGTQSLGDTLQNNLDYSDIDRHGFLTNPEALTPITWDSSTYNTEGENSSDILRGHERPQNSMFENFLLNTDSQTHSHVNSESNIPHLVPISSEDVANIAAPKNPTENATPKNSSANPCTCLQKHAEVLSNPILSEIRASNGSEDGVWSLDKALSLAKQAMKAWQCLLTCPCCPYNDDEEVMLLTFMSIRAVTRYLQLLSPRYNNTARASPHGSGSVTAQSVSDDISLRIGSYELEGDDRVLVLRILYQNTLQKVKSMLHSLQVIQEKKKKRLSEETRNRLAGDDDYQASSNLFHIQQMSYSLVTSLQALESSLNGK